MAPSVAPPSLPAIGTPPASFVGKNFHYRPYFQQAMAGDSRGVISPSEPPPANAAITSLIRSAAPNAVVGVVVVKIDLNDIEEQWNDELTDLLVTDIDDVIFISTRESWKFKTLRAAVRLRSAAYRRQPAVCRSDSWCRCRSPSGNRWHEGVELITLLEESEPDAAGERSHRPAQRCALYAECASRCRTAELNVVALAQVESGVIAGLECGGADRRVILTVLVLLGVVFAATSADPVFERQRFQGAGQPHVGAERGSGAGGYRQYPGRFDHAGFPGPDRVVQPDRRGTVRLQCRARSEQPLFQPSDQPKPDRAVCWRMITDPQELPEQAQVPVLEVQARRQDDAAVPDRADHRAGARSWRAQVYRHASMT